MHSLYILLFALGVYSSVGLIQVGQTSSTSPCQKKLPFNNSPISAFYEQKIRGTGCVANLTTKTNQEVHVINLKRPGPVYRNAIAEVHLFVKSRNDDEVLWDPLIIVLNSIDPVRWRVRTELLAPASKRHVFVVPSYSSVRLVKGNSRRMVRHVDHLPQKIDKLYRWTKQRYGAVTSFSELDRGNQITLLVGPDANASADCDLVAGGATNVQVIYEQPKLLSGCMMTPKTTIMDKQAYVIELRNVEPYSDKHDSKKYVDVELEIKGRNKRKTHRNLLLVLKSPSHVMWKIKTKKLEGYAEIVSNSHIDMSGIKMDPVSERIEEFTETGDKFLKWVEVYVGQVAMYTSISLANKIKLTIPDNEDKDRQEPEKAAILINPFDNVRQTKQFLKQNTKTSCHKHGVIRVTLGKVLLTTFRLDLVQISLRRSSCTPSIDASSIVLESAEEECGTRKVVKNGKTYLYNEVIIHRSAGDTVETGSGDYQNDDGDLEEVEGSGGGTLSTFTETRVDDEDYSQVDMIKTDVSCLLQEDDNIVPIDDTNKEYNVKPDVSIDNHYPPVSDFDVTFELQIFKSPLYLDPSYMFPMDVALNDRVYVEASIVGDRSMRVQILTCDVISNHQSVLPLIHNGCIVAGTSWEPVPIGRPFMGSVTQGQRFSFTHQTLRDFINQYTYISCHLTVCRNYLTKENEKIPQCIDNKEDVCKNGLPGHDGGVPSQSGVTKGPMKLVIGTNTQHTPQTNAPGILVEPSDQPAESNKQSVVVDGLESGTVIGIAFAAFFIGVLLMAALWFIHTHTGPLKHAVASGRAGLDGSGENTPMSTAPITVNS